MRAPLLVVVVGGTCALVRVEEGDVCRGRFESKSKGVSLAESV